MYPGSPPPHAPYPLCGRCGRAYMIPSTESAGTRWGILGLGIVAALGLVGGFLCCLAWIVPPIALVAMFVVPRPVRSVLVCPSCGLRARL